MNNQEWKSLTTFLMKTAMKRFNLEYAEAEEAAQETILRMLEQEGRTNKPIQDYRAYGYSILHQCAGKILKEKKRLYQTNMPTELHEYPEDDINTLTPEERIANREILEAVQTALNPRHITIKNILKGKRRGISKAALYKRKSRALSKLRYTKPQQQSTLVDSPQAQEGV